MKSGCQGGRRAAFATASAMLLVLAGMRSAVPEPLTGSTAAYYNSVIATMNALPVPGSLDFRTAMVASGIGVRLSDENGTGKLLAGIGSGFQHDDAWQTHLAGGHDATVTTTGNRVLRTPSPIFNPTWSGAFDWLRYGLHGPLATSTPASTVSSPGPQPSDAEGTIGRVVAISTAFYRVADAGEAACPNGSPGRHLHLTAWRDPQTHPVTDVGVDAASNRICLLRFNIGTSSALSLTGSYELHFANVDGYWLAVSGDGTFLLRMFGVGAKHAALHVTYAEISTG